MARLDAAAVIDREIDDHGTAFHRLHHFLGHEIRGAAVGGHDGADQDVGDSREPLDIPAGGDRRDRVLASVCDRMTQPLEIGIDDDDMRPGSQGEPRRRPVNRSGTGNDDRRGGDAGDLREQNSAAPSSYCRSCAAHWIVMWPAISDRARSTRCAPDPSSIDSHPMSVTSRLASSESTTLGIRAKGLVGEVGVSPGLVLDKYFTPETGESRHTERIQPDPVLVSRNIAWNSDFHGGLAVVVAPSGVRSHP